MVNHVKRHQRTIQCIKQTTTTTTTWEQQNERWTCTRTSATASSSILTCQHGSCVSVRTDIHSFQSFGCPNVRLPHSGIYRGSATCTRVGHTHAQHNHIIQYYNLWTYVLYSCWSFAITLTTWSVGARSSHDDAAAARWHVTKQCAH